MNTTKQEPALTPPGQKSEPSQVWQTELSFAMPIVIFVFYLFYIWYAVLDRYFIFLYFHDMGTGFDTTPFGPITSSRYWMAGLVAAAAVMVPYVAMNLVLGRLIKPFRAPVWWRQWLLCAVPLMIAIPVLVMTVNDPVLPLANAVQVTAVTLIGLALALMPGKMAAEKPIALIWPAVDGFAPAILLLFLVHLERLPELTTGNVAVIIILVVVSLILIAIMTAFYWWRRIQPPDTITWLVAGLIIAYLLVPLCHHIFSGNGCDNCANSGYFAYITNSSNFLAGNVLMQITVWGVVALLALGVTRLRQRLLRQRMA